MPIDYEEKYKKAYKDNVRYVVKQIQKGELDDKIDNFCSLHDFDRDDLISGIEKNVYLQAVFAINPNKQNIYEKIAGEYIKNIVGVTEFKKLPNDKLYISNGGIMTKEQKKQMGSVSTAKTIDFTWQFSRCDFYASHKHTTQSGGTQGGQYKDLQAFITEANKTISSNNYFIAIADGDFYQMKDTEVNTKRIDRLKKDANNQKRVYACNINELKDLMKRITA